MSRKVKFGILANIDLEYRIEPSIVINYKRTFRNAHTFLALNLFTTSCCTNIEDKKMSKGKKRMLASIKAAASLKTLLSQTAKILNFSDRL